jgi:hypothetical protein
MAFGLREMRRFSRASGVDREAGNREQGAREQELAAGDSAAWRKWRPYGLGRDWSEQDFCSNNRATKDHRGIDSDRFALGIVVAGRRLAFARLKGRDSDSVCHAEAGTGQEEPF